MLFICGEEVFSVENDISAQKAAKSKSAWF
jgi:hypothetical protein